MGCYPEAGLIRGHLSGHRVECAITPLGRSRVINATALLAAVGDGSAFSKGRDLAAWLGLTPRQHSTGG